MAVHGLFPCGLKDREKVLDYGGRLQVPAADVAACQKWSPLAH